MERSFDLNQGRTRISSMERPKAMDFSEALRDLEACLEREGASLRYGKASSKSRCCRKTN